MDNLTHGLFGLAIGALRRPSLKAAGGLSETDKATLVACVVAAELPDLDALWPAGDSVLGVLQAHRGPSHALLAAPLVALVAAGLAQVLFRRAQFRVSLVWGLLSCIGAHLMADAWTGWGTRLWLPLSSARVTWDWTLVVDPLVTLPLLGGVVWALRNRAQWRRAVLLGAAGAVFYVGARAGVRALLLSQVRAQWVSAERVEVFPAWFSFAQWRFVAALPDAYVAGTVRPFRPGEIQGTHPRVSPPIEEAQLAHRGVQEALAWARMPVVRTQPDAAGGTELSILDLRYHLGGEPTLGFSFSFDAHGALRESRMVRGGSAAELLQRFRRAN